MQHARLARARHQNNLQRAIALQQEFRPRFAVRSTKMQCVMLAGALSDRDLSVRVAVTTTLEKFGPQAAAALPELLRAVNTGDADARIGALRALGAIGKDGQRVVPVAARALVPW